jgi:hypothetical protein
MAPEVDQDQGCSGGIAEDAKSEIGLQTSSPIVA